MFRPLIAAAGPVALAALFVAGCGWTPGAFSGGAPLAAGGCDVTGGPGPGALVPLVAAILAWLALVRARRAAERQRVPVRKRPKDRRRPAGKSGRGRRAQ